MLKLIYNMHELDEEQLLRVYSEHNWDEQDFLSYLRYDFFGQHDALYAVWMEGSLYKSAVRLERCHDGLLLHSLETAPDARRKGYAYQLLTNLLDFLHTTNCDAIYSHVEKKNKASLLLHKKCGFKMIADCATYLDGTVTQYSYTMCYRI